METKTKTRKVIKLGNNLSVTLPKEFTDRANIKKGDLVGITYDSLLVIINPRMPEEK